MISKELDYCISSSKIANFIYSDHNIIILKLYTDKIQRGTGTWKLNTSILEQNDYLELIEDFWRSWKHEKKSYKSKRLWWDMTKYHIKVLSIEFCTMKKQQQTNIKSLENG